MNKPRFIILLFCLLFAGCGPDTTPHQSNITKLDAKLQTILKDNDEIDKKFEDAMSKLHEYDLVREEASAAMKAKDYDAALIKYSKALTLLLVLNENALVDPFPLANLYMQIGDTHRAKGQIVEAYHTYKKGCDTLSTVSDEAYAKQFSSDPELAQAARKLLADQRAMLDRRRSLLEAMIKAGGLDEALPIPISEQKEVTH